MYLEQGFNAFCRRHAGTNPVAHALAHQRDWEGSNGNGYRVLIADKAPVWMGFGGAPGTIGTCGRDRNSWEEAQTDSSYRETKAGRAATAALAPAAGASPADVEAFANLVKAHTAQTREWRVLSGTEIAAAYRAPVSYGSGSLAGSCMNGKSAAVFDLYANNPGRVRLLTAWCGDELEGRALVWETDEGITVVDRAYGSDATRTAIRLKAAENGWHKRQHDDYEEENALSFLDPAGGRTRRHLTVTLDAKPAHGFPYCDTFYCYDPDDGIVGNHRFGSGLGLLRSTSGFLHYVCDGCGDATGSECINRTDDGEVYCRSCYRSRCCEECGDYVGEEDDLCDECHAAHTCTACGVFEEDYVLEDGLCDGCRPDRCADCREEVANDAETASDYCDACRTAHTCPECGHEHDGTGMCYSCQNARTCLVCGEIRPPTEILTIRRAMTWGGHCRTRICRACERARLTAMLARAKERYETRQREAGQLAIAIAA